MSVSGIKLGLDSKDNIHIVNLKCPLEIGDSFRLENGIFPAYHMNKAHWLSAALDGSVDNDTLELLLAISHSSTAPKISRKKSPSKK